MKRGVTISNFKSILKIATAFIGAIVGAGFASGQEIVQYYTSFGIPGLFGSILATILYMFVGMALVRIGSRLRTRSHKEAVYQIGGKFVGTVIDYVLILTLFGVGVVMLAGAGSNLSQQFNLPVVFGTTLITVLIFVIGVLQLNKIIVIIGSITPFLLIFVILIAIYSIFHTTDSLASLNQIAKEQPTNLPNWWISFINHVSFNTSVGAAIAFVIGGEEKNEKNAIMGGLLGGLGLGFIIILGNGAIFSQMAVLDGQALPILEMVNNISPILGIFMALVLYAMIFNTAISMFLPFTTRFTKIGTKHFAFFLGTTLIIAYIASFIGFSDLIGLFYPVIGFLGLVLLITLAISWLRLNRLEKQYS